MVEFPSETIWAWISFLAGFWIIKSTSLIIIWLFNLSITYQMSCGSLCILRNWSIYLNCQIDVYRNVLLWSFWFLQGLCWYPISLLILVICVFSFFLHQANQYYCPFKRTSSSFHWFFPVYFSIFSLIDFFIISSCFLWVYFALLFLSFWSNNLLRLFFFLIITYKFWYFIFKLFIQWHVFFNFHWEVYCLFFKSFFCYLFIVDF